MSLHIVVSHRGPLWDGEFGRAVSDFIDAAVWEITKVGRGELGVRFITVFREPTGYYESQVSAVRPVMHTGYIRDGGVIYSFWLEGLGSRNFPVTRFRGYHSFRTIAASMDAKATFIAERVLPPYLARMGGGHVT